ncbi:hypothetical protein [uncultured Amphritea sp.]|uniref:hypothetical protein n=1 Tax=uncultured Amphritea sp. TaxID=981605 RepID=UPI0026165C17|nr:hypothetical protein [uncultured Amphritea sp.]
MAGSGMSTSAMGGGGFSFSDETSQDLKTSVNVGGFSGGNFSVNKSIFDGLNSSDRTTKLITGAVMLGGAVVMGMFLLKLAGGK